MKRRDFFAWLFFVLFSLFSSVILATADHSYDSYIAIAALPFVFFVCGLLFNNVYTHLSKNIGVLCLHSVMFIRMVLSPVLMAQANYDSIFRYILKEDINHAVVMLCYETVLVYGVLSFLISHSKDKLSKESYTIKCKRPSWLFRLIVLGMTVFCVVVWFTVPTCRELYKTIFEFGEETFTTVEYSASFEAVGSVERASQTLFKMLFDMLRLLLPMGLFIWFKRYRVSSFVAIVTGIILAFVQMLFISSTTARAVICAFLIIYFIARLYPDHAKRIMNTAIVLSVLVIVAYFAIRFSVGSRYGTDPAEYLSKIVNAYFGGVDNVAAGSNLPEGFEASTFWASLYSAIPFNSTLFGLKVENLQALYNAANSSYGQIPPMIVEGEYYFGIVLAPLMSCLCAVGAYHYGEKYAKTTSAWHLISNLFIAIMCAISVVMYNEEILLVWLIEWLLPMRILSALADREKTT